MTTTLSSTSNKRVEITALYVTSHPLVYFCHPN